MLSYHALMAMSGREVNNIETENCDLNSSKSDGNGTKV